jgi:hypothetical protein
MPLILGTNSIKDTGYDVANSLRFNDGDSPSLTQTHSGAGNRKTFTISAWVKRSTLSYDYAYIFTAGTYNSTQMAQFKFDSNDQLNISGYASNGSQEFRVLTNQKFRDTSAFYHLLASVDTTQATASNRVKLYINGTLYSGGFVEASYPSEDYDSAFNSDIIHSVGIRNGTSTYYDGYMAELVMVDGSALDSSSFGEFDEDSPTIWKPKDVSGLTFGTNGFYLDFENASSLGADVSGNSNNFTVNNLTSIDQSTDTCTNNFCTLSVTLNTAIEYSEGALKGVKASGDSNQRQWGSTFAVNSGKWYWECKNHLSSTNHWYIGIIDAESIPHSMTNFPGDTTKSYGIRGSDGNKLYNASASSYGSAISNGDVVMIALDLDNKKIWFGENGTFFNSGDPAGGSNEAFDITDGDFYMPSFTSTGGGGEGWFCNFGSPAYSITSGNADGNGFGNFEYAPPSGFLSLCSKNLGENS